MKIQKLPMVKSLYPLHFQGHQSEYVHQGIITVLLDEVMMHINHAMNLDVHTGELTVRYLQLAKVNEPLYLRGYFVKKNKKIVENRAELEDEIGKIIARQKVNISKLIRLLGLVISPAEVVKLVDALDSKSSGGNSVPVRPRPSVIFNRLVK